MLGNIYYNVLVTAKSIKNLNKEVSGELVINEFKDRANASYYYGTFTPSNNDSDTNLPNNVVIQSFSQKEYIVNRSYHVKGTLLKDQYYTPSRDLSDSLKQLQLSSYNITDLLSSDRTVLLFKVSESALIDDADPKKEMSIKVRYMSIRNELNLNIQKTMKKYLSPQSSSLIIPMTLGNDEDISREVKDHFRESGLSHILVLSGQNLSLFLIGVIFIFSRRSKLEKTAILAAALFIYLLSVEIGESILRASIMSAYMIVGSLMLKKMNYKHSLWIAIAALLILYPALTVHSISLQLSILAVMSILHFSPVIMTCLKRLPNSVSGIISVALSVNVLIMPYLLYSFGNYNIVSPIANIIAAPISALMLCLGTQWMLISQVSYLISGVNSNIVDYVLFVPATILSLLTEIASSILLGVVTFFSTNTIWVRANLSFTDLIISYVIIYIAYRIYRTLKKKL
jgi:ComEC/Rec2-related protein